MLPLFSIGGGGAFTAGFRWGSASFFSLGGIFFWGSPRALSAWCPAQPPAQFFVACAAGDVCCGGASLACASASPADAVAIAAARQTTPSAAAIGRTNSRMAVSQGLDGFRLGQERPEDGQTMLKRIWRQIMAETNQHGRTAKQRRPPYKKTPPPRGKAAFVRS